MKPTPQRDLEVALIQANTGPLQGRTIFWLLSRTQLEYILREIAIIPSSRGKAKLQRAQYQEETLPVISLEKYFGLPEPDGVQSYTYIVIKSVNTDGRLTRSILRSSSPVRVRKATFTAEPMEDLGLMQNDEHILGAFALEDNQLAVIPDMQAILQKLAG